MAARLLRAPSSKSRGTRRMRHCGGEIYFLGGFIFQARTSIGKKKWVIFFLVCVCVSFIWTRFIDAMIQARKCQHIKMLPLLSTQFQPTLWRCWCLFVCMWNLECTVYVKDHVYGIHLFKTVMFFVEFLESYLLAEPRWHSRQVHCNSPSVKKRFDRFAETLLATARKVGDIDLFQPETGCSNPKTWAWLMSTEKYPDYPDSGVPVPVTFC